jgi:hypothetical protein
MDATRVLTTLAAPTSDLSAVGRVKCGGRLATRGRLERLARQREAPQGRTTHEDRGGAAATPSRSEPITTRSSVTEHLESCSTLTRPVGGPGCYSAPPNSRK